MAYKKYPKIENASRKANIYIFKLENFDQVMKEIERQGLEVRDVYYEPMAFGLETYWIAEVE